MTTRPSPLSEPRSLALSGGRVLNYQLFRSHKRRTIGIEVHPDQSIRVRAPWQISTQQIEDALRVRAQWIQDKQGLQAARPDIKETLYQTGSQHLYLGDSYRLIAVRGRAAVQLDTQAQCITVRSPDGSEEQTRTALLHWYREQAILVFAERLELWRNRLQDWPMLPNTLQVRRMKRTWGSCNSAGKVTLNSLAVKLPTSLIDYILSHELCHLREMNHSEAFYRWHERIMPDYRDKRQALKRLEAEALNI